MVPANKRRCVELAASDDADEPGPSSHLLDVDRLQAADAALLHSNKPGTDLGTPLARAGLTNKPQQPSPTSHAGMLPDSSQAQEPNPEHHALQNSVQPAVEQVHKQDDDVTANADSSDSEDMLQVRRSTRRRVHNARADNHVESDELQEMFMPLETATQLEEEGLDPLPEQATEQRASRRTSSGRPSRMDIRARMQQNQQKLRQVYAQGEILDRCLQPDQYRLQCLTLSHSPCLLCAYVEVNYNIPSQHSLHMALAAA